ncbi:transcription factor protein [Rutstroemia sp. NJR-2017a WRK4]|nr:transcription factor protein [Rutstroemia sp. NJR-2017a WRK4]
MAAHYRDDLLHGKDHPDTHASANLWRHNESTSFSRHASPAPRLADERHGSKDLTNFLRTSRVEGNGANGVHKPIVVSGNAHSAELESLRAEQEKLAQQDAANGIKRTGGGAHVKCGPLLNYRRMEDNTWFGSVLIVTETGSGEEGSIPELRLRISGTPRDGTDLHISNGSTDDAATGTNGHLNGSHDSTSPNSFQQTNGAVNGGRANGAGDAEETKIAGVKLYADAENTFWRFLLAVPMQQQEIQCEYTIPGLTFSGSKTDRQQFYVPAVTESMRILFHSCNGFSVGTDEAAFSGPCLWNDVLRQHTQTPFHVMLGGGDQIYNDGIRVNGPLRQWTDIGNPKKRREYPFPRSLQIQCDDYYVKNYLKWYSTEPFASANGKIPQVNLWDDHDIIDGFGSYVDEFMRCSVFRGIGGVAQKYYLLFQHHVAPPATTFVTDAPQPMSADNVGLDPRYLDNVYVLEDDVPDSSYIIGDSPGPYVAEKSRSIYARLGARIAFFGIDARTERTRHQVNYPETYKKIFTRLRAELTAAKASPSPIQHLIILLGIPIAYPSLDGAIEVLQQEIWVWYATPFLLTLLKLTETLGGSFFNHFDGSVDLLDDLDDHYTAHTHKKERQYLVKQLQALASEFSVRITILGGDVHLAAVGRFYSNPNLQVPASKDHRYMANIISSAIVNKPPPQAVANLLARRNKIHHLDPQTDETLLYFFDQDPGAENKTSKSNHVTMPSRNWAMITENSPTSTSAPNEIEINGVAYDLAENEVPKDGHYAIHKGEQNAGTQHKAADYGKHGAGSDGSLDVCIRVEVDQHDKEGRTRGYGMTIPVLRVQGGPDSDAEAAAASWKGSVRDRVRGGSAGRS